MISNALVLPLVLAFASISSGQSPDPVKGDFILKDFRFRSGDMLPELRMRYLAGSAQWTNFELSQHKNGIARIDTTRSLRSTYGRN